jgi:hypothetical protein
LRLVYESGADVHRVIIARPGWAWKKRLTRAVLRTS